MKNWKTTLGGFLTSVGFALTQIASPEWVSVLGGILASTGALILGTYATEDKPTK